MSNFMNKNHPNNNNETNSLANHLNTLINNHNSNTSYSTYSNNLIPKDDRKVIKQSMFVGSYENP